MLVIAERMSLLLERIIKYLTDETPMSPLFLDLSSGKFQKQRGFLVFSGFYTAKQEIRLDFVQLAG